jgi:radical SAM protein with 4Fe4S-binding SPASM domain
MKASLERIFPEYVRRSLRFLRQRKHMLASFPSSFGFEVTTKCNLKCKMCARQDMGFIEPKDLDFFVIEKVVNEVASLPKRKALLNLAGLSEPLLYPNLVKAVKYIKQKVPHATVKTITNGIVLRGDLAVQLINDGLDFITISLNTGSAESYRWLTETDKYDQVVDNILNFIRLRRELHTSSPAINIDLKITDRTRDEIESTKTFWLEKLLPTDTVTTRRLFEFRDLIDVKDLDQLKNTTERYPCLMLWSTIKLDIDGNVYPCDGKVMHYGYRSKSELCLGNIYESSLIELYVNKSLRDIRNKHLKDDYTSLPTCTRCDAYEDCGNFWMRNKYFPFTWRKWL